MTEFEIGGSADLIKRFFGTISFVTDEAVLKSNADGVSVKAVDPAHIMMVNANLNASALTSFKTSGTDIGIDLKKMNDALKLAKGPEPVSITYDDKKNRLVVRVGKITRTLALVDTTGMAEPKTPTMTLDTRFVLAPALVAQAIKASETVSDQIVVKATKAGVKFEADSDLDTVAVDLSEDDLVELVSNDDAMGRYSIDYLSNIIRVAVGNTTIELDTNKPVRVSFDFPDNGGHATYLLAPRIESD